MVGTLGLRRGIRVDLVHLKNETDALRMIRCI
jgi:hypothetical protein